MKITQVRTAVPGWYDAEWLAARQKKCKTCRGVGYVTPALQDRTTKDGQFIKGCDGDPCPDCHPEKGALIRSRVPVTSKKISVQLQDEEKRIKAKYGDDLRIFVVPKLVQENSTAVDLSGATDMERVENYVASALPEAVRFTAKRVVAYLSSRLSAISYRANARAVRFIGLRGENVLSFKNIEIKYSKQGLVLLKGRNRDYRGVGAKSNGAGKTSSLSLLPVAMFGETPNKRKHDSWAYEHNKRPAKLDLVLRDDRNRKIEIMRGRRPAKINLTINGEDQSRGIRGVGKQETQGAIEQETGYSLKMLINSVYIDQSIANGFLFGAQKTKMDLVSKLQDLDRYEAALKLVTKDLAELYVKQGAASTRVTKNEEALRRLRAERKELVVEEQDASIWLKAAKAAKKEFEVELATYQGLKASEEVTARKKTAMAEIQREIAALNEKTDGADKALDQLQAEEARILKLHKAGKCPMCGQRCQDVPLDKHNKAEQKRLKYWMNGWAAECEKLIAKLDKLTDYVETYEANLEKAERNLSEARWELKSAETGEKEESIRRKKVIEKRKLFWDGIIELKEQLETDQALLRKWDIRQEMLLFSQKAFHRSGMPLYLSSSLCSVMNRSAEEYSELFWDGSIKVQFGIEDGELAGNVLNPSGSNQVAGQSVGEAAMAGLVTAFAVRDSCPKTNLLILDEPGHGLDEQGQKQFAEGLLKLRDSGRFETILVTTHSRVIQGVLEGEAKIWRIVKRHRVSRLLTT